MIASPTDELTRRLRRAIEMQLPPPGTGRTAERLRALFDIAVDDLEVARLAEAHHDAVAIGAELGRAARPGALYGVWAASGRDPLTASRRAGGWRLAGVVPWCTGIGMVDRALVSAATDAGPILVDVDVRAGQVVPGEAAWASPAFAATNTGSLRFDIDIGSDDVVGEPGAYLDRPGFWHGAVGVSACWAGGLRGLLDLHVARWRRRDPHALAHLGGATAWSRTTVDVLAAAASEIDAAPDDRAASEVRARQVRHVVERACTLALDDLGVGAGPEPLAFDDAILRRTQQLQLYIRQCHGERDLEPVGTITLARRDAARTVSESPGSSSPSPHPRSTS